MTEGETEFTEFNEGLNRIDNQISEESLPQRLPELQGLPLPLPISSSSSSSGEISEPLKVLPNDRDELPNREKWRI